jgi:cytochrome b6-f complex iron-sulfur subunit
MDRRTFLGWVGVGGLATSLPVVLAACGNDDDKAYVPKAATGETPGAGQFTTVGSLADIDQKGFLANKEMGVLVIRNPAKTSELLAFSSKCPHKGCDVGWQAPAFVCPCHGATFSATGEPTHDPARTPLTAFKVKLEGTNVLVSV